MALHNILMKAGYILHLVFHCVPNEEKGLHRVLSDTLFQHLSAKMLIRRL